MTIVCATTLENINMLKYVKITFLSKSNIFVEGTFTRQIILTIILNEITIYPLTRAEFHIELHFWVSTLR